jgi:hypothetical protein
MDGRSDASEVGLEQQILFKLGRNDERLDQLERVVTQMREEFDEVRSALEILLGRRIG